MKHLYLSEDGEVKLFERFRAPREFVEVVYPKIRIEDLDENPNQIINLRERRWTRLDIAPPEMDMAIRRLVAERDEAREIVRESMWRHPDVSPGWVYNEKAEKAIERWDHPLEKVK